MTPIPRKVLSGKLLERKLTSEETVNKIPMYRTYDGEF
jgi:hypothetical protein